MTLKYHKCGPNGGLCLCRLLTVISQQLMYLYRFTFTHTRMYTHLYQNGCA